MKRHEQSCAVIIGGTQGLGFAVGKRLIAEGCTKMVIAGRNPQRGEEAAQNLAALNGADVAFVATDLANPDACIGLIDGAVKRMGRVNVLLNAGASTERGSLCDATPAQFDDMMAINARGPFFAMQAFANHAIAGDYAASCVNILSMSQYCGQSFLAPYAASKAALATLTKNAAQALRSKHLRFNGIACGWMDTPGEDAIQRRYHGAGDDWLAKAEAAQPFGKLVKPDEVAGLAAYLLTAESGVMTGAIIDYDQYVCGAYPE
ncbi:SDR family oxidoreductase [Thalassospira mesophila]|uniref:Short-chain dehydrogenase n=1 Tax=Thalassospira mesophila TaxID=1293891 RepID=A0A1Y2KX66_9PROT|nr:SDR family oxidoreductase [Thalassospira mesophila]OSQ36950.1 short-chain dehydrogenase [Thalassospira mesophila]